MEINIIFDSLGNNKVKSTVPVGLGDRYDNLQTLLHKGGMMTICEVDGMAWPKFAQENIDIISGVTGQTLLHKQAAYTVRMLKGGGAEENVPLAVSMNMVGIKGFLTKIGDNHDVVMAALPKIIENKQSTAILDQYFWSSMQRDIEPQTVVSLLEVKENLYRPLKAGDARALWSSFVARNQNNAGQLFLGVYGPVLNNTIEKRILDMQIQKLFGKDVVEKEAASHYLKQVLPDNLQNVNTPVYESVKNWRTRSDHSHFWAGIDNDTGQSVANLGLIPVIKGEIETERNSKSVTNLRDAVTNTTGRMLKMRQGKPKDHTEVGLI